MVLMFFCYNYYEYFAHPEVSKSLSFQFIIGSGTNMCDFTYVENVAHAIICLEQVLCSEEASVAGKVLLWRIFFLLSCYSDFIGFSCSLICDYLSLLFCSHSSLQIMKE